MRLQYLLTQDIQSPSGLGRFFPIAREMARLGHEVEMIALHPDFERLDEREFELSGVHINYVAPMHVRKQGNQKSYYSPAALLAVTARATWMLGQGCLKTKVDILHICKPHPMNSVAGMLAKIFRGQTLFLDCDDYEAASSRFGGRWQQELVRYFERTMPARVNQVTTNTLTMRRHLMEWGVPEDRIHYLPNGVDHERFGKVDPERVENLRSQLGIGQKKVVAYIGSLSLPSHPVDLLLEAFARYQQRDENAVLVIVGGGEDMDILRSMAEKLGIARTTFFCGRISPDEASLYYKLSSVSVDPIYDDEAARCRSPLKLFESWAAGAPFLSSDVGDRSLLLGEPPAGLLVQAGNPDEMANGLYRILSDEAYQETLRQRGLEKVKEYTWDVLARKLEAVYQAW